MNEIFISTREGYLPEFKDLSPEKKFLFVMDMVFKQL